MNIKGFGSWHISEPIDPRSQRIAWTVLVCFLLTFIAARVLVFLIVSRRLPDMYLYLGSTHVHHLNYGIFLLAGVGGYLLFSRLDAQKLLRAAPFYGIGLALTFDEFGMWLHLGGSYWQRASFDAVVVIAALLGLIVAGPRLRRFKPRDWVATTTLAISVLIFGITFVDSFKYADRLLIRIQVIEQSYPPLP